MDLTPSMIAALSASEVRFFICVEVNLPGYNLRLLDGASEVTWGAPTFLGRDPTYGVLDNIDSIADGLGDQAPSMSITFLPPDESAVADLVDPDMQGSRIRVWLGALNADGTVVPDPHLLFDGELDQPVLSVGKGTRDVTYDCVSQFERLFRNEEGSRLNFANQRHYYPNDAGLDDVTGITRSILWGPGQKVNGATSGFGG